MKYAVKATAYAVAYIKHENKIIEALVDEFNHPQEFYYDHNYAVARRRQHVKDILTSYGLGYTEALKALMPLIEKMPDEKSSWLK